MIEDGKALAPSSPLNPSTKEARYLSGWGGLSLSVIFWSSYLWFLTRHQIYIHQILCTTLMQYRVQCTPPVSFEYFVGKLKETVEYATPNTVPW